MKAWEGAWKHVEAACNLELYVTAAFSAAPQVLFMCSAATLNSQIPILLMDLHK